MPVLDRGETVGSASGILQLNEIPGRDKASPSASDIPPDIPGLVFKARTKAGTANKSVCTNETSILRENFLTWRSLN